jgi:phosphotransferase system HPr-like phosphotransfer protein
MLKKTIQLPSVNAVKTFVNAAMLAPCDIDLIHGKYAVDGKSIMGVLSLDLSSTLEMNVDTDKEAEVVDFLNMIKEFIVE